MKNLQTYSDLRERIEGTEAETLDKLAQEYKLLEKELKDKSARFEEIKTELKKLGAGSFETGEYMFDLYERKGSKSIDKTLIEKLYPEIYEDEKIWKTSKPSLVLDKVERKN